jgi:DNA-dependent RNA polymerase auxiliary subunit epsilon
MEFSPSTIAFVVILLAIYLIKKKVEQASFVNRCNEIYTLIRQEAGEDGVLSIKKIVTNEHSSSSKEEREKIIEYLEFALITKIADSIINIHSKVLRRKHKQSLYFDEYGFEVKDKWLKERKYFVKNILIAQLQEKTESLENSFITEERNNYVMSNSSDNIQFWEDFIDRWIAYDKELEELEGIDIAEFDNCMGGLNYERFVSHLIESDGWDCLVTPPTGDHGADIIVTDGDLRFAIQCKLYSSPVGNKSVQEVYSAKDYYECDFAIVVSNAEYTTAARQVASSLGVLLLHHEDIRSVLNTYSEEVTE